MVMKTGGKDWIESAPSEPHGAEPHGAEPQAAEMQAGDMRGAELRGETKMAMDVWAAGDESALSEVCECIEPLLFCYLFDETHDVELSRELLDQTILRVQFGAYGHETDVVGWALEVAHRLASARLAVIAHARAAR